MKVITYGTFDLFHDGHVRLLKRAKALGDHLTVGVTTENYDDARGKLNVQQSLMNRIKNVQDSGLADEVIIEEYEGQKVNDLQKHSIDVFAIGSDWEGKFDYLKDYCDVVYLERTEGISSTALRAANSGILKLGVVGNGRIAHRFLAESHFVSGVHVEGVFSRTSAGAEAFRQQHKLKLAASSYEQLLDRVDAVYVATPHEFHFDYALKALTQGKHVLCEKPVALSLAQTDRLYAAAQQHNVVLLEAIKTAYSPGFQRLVAVARSGSIGEIKSVDATFTKLVDQGRELNTEYGGSISELASYPLLAVIKLLGTDYKDVRTFSHMNKDDTVDLFSRIDLLFTQAVASARVGLGVKAEGDLVIAGTQGYIYVPAPWWKTEYFETRFEDQRMNKKFYYKFDGDGLRYELAEFASLVKQGLRRTFKLSPEESIAISTLIEHARAHKVRFK